MSGFNPNSRQSHDRGDSPPGYKEAPGHTAPKEKERSLQATNPDEPPSSRIGSQPPRYSLVFGDPDEQVPNNAPPTQHEFWLSSGVFKSKPWAGLRVLTRPSSTLHRVPRIYGGDNVTGIILLDISNPTTINSITLSLRGRILTSFAEHGAYTFLEETLEVWAKSGSSAPTSPTSPTASQQPNTKRDGKFAPGKHDFPFTIPFPTEVNISAGYVGKGKRVDRAAVVCYSPQTFLEQQLGANIEYELVLVINYGILKQDSKLKAPVIFIPEIRPDPPSARRLTSYTRNIPLIGPMDDPNGWQTLPAIRIQGTFEKERAVVLDYTLYLALPLSYTRGTVIPCFLRLSCPDRRCLLGLSDPGLQIVRLGRRVTYYKDPNKGIDRHIRLQSPQDRSRGSAKDPSTSWDFDEAEVAVWWTPQGLDQGGSGLHSGFRWLEGEIHLAEDLPPTSSFLPFTIEYAVEVMPYETSLFREATSRQPDGSRPAEDTFSLEGPSTRALLSYPVTIATCHHVEGPRARPYTKRQQPSMARRKLKDEGDSIGQLQRYGIPPGLD